jgi:hypothetical protein
MLMRNLEDEDMVAHLPIGDPPEPDYDPDKDPDDEDLDVEPEDDEEEEDFSDLDELLAEATAASEEDKRLKAARKRLSKVQKSNHPNADTEALALVAEIRELEAKRIWLTVGCVALFHTQTCATCGAHHAFFQGWMTAQQHLTDPNARRLVKGRPVEKMPETREDHFQGVVEACSNCIECVIAIDEATHQGEGL